VKVEDLPEQETEPLVAELAYVISKTHRDLYELSPTEIPLVHQVVVLSDEPGKPEQVCSSRLRVRVCVACTQAWHG
jgi:hypothetical protein